MHAYEIDPAENADLGRIAQIERERADRAANGFSLVVPASDPDHGAIFGGMLSRLSAGVAAAPPRRTGAERREHDLAWFGAPYVQLIERQFPSYYRGA